jgi:hypothetical protein
MSSLQFMFQNLIAKAVFKVGLMKRSAGTGSWTWREYCRQGERLLRPASTAGLGTAAPGGGCHSKLPQGGPCQPPWPLAQTARGKAAHGGQAGGAAAAHLRAVRPQWCPTA